MQTTGLNRKEENQYIKQCNRPTQRQANECSRYPSNCHQPGRIARTLAGSKILLNRDKLWHTFSMPLRSSTCKVMFTPCTSILGSSWRMLYFGTGRFSRACSFCTQQRLGVGVWNFSSTSLDDLRHDCVRGLQKPFSQLIQNTGPKGSLRLYRIPGCPQVGIYQSSWALNLYYMLTWTLCVYLGPQSRYTATPLDYKYTPYAYMDPFGCRLAMKHADLVYRK